MSAGARRGPGVRCFVSVGARDPYGQVRRAQPAYVAFGGTGRTRTGNLLDAIEALSSLSYGPIRSCRSCPFIRATPGRKSAWIGGWSDGESHPDPCSANAAFSC